MKHSRAAFTLGILIVVAGLTVALHRFMLRAQPSPAASSMRSTRPVPAHPALSASAIQPSPKVRPPYLDTDAKTLDEQREALLVNMKNQLDLPPGALEKIASIFAGSIRI